MEDEYDCITLPHREVLLIPKKFAHVPFDALLSEEKEPVEIPTYKHHEDGFLELVHADLRLRSDILMHSKHTGFGVSEEEMIACVPESLFMFIRLMFGGQSLFEGDDDTEDTTIEGREKTHRLGYSV